jgi:Tol biopolymer transport system component
VKENTHFVAHSWSPDGKYLVGVAYEKGIQVVLSVYSIETGRYEIISEFGLQPRWLGDNKRVVFVFEDKIYLTDTRSKRPREIFSFAPKVLSSIDISRDNRSIYVSAISTD